MENVYSFDDYGWFTPGEIPGRTTPVPPPEPVGELLPNWTGIEWVLIPYTPPPEPHPQDPVRRLVTVPAFFDRFGALKWQILADQNPMVRAVITDAQVRPYIDLDHDQLPAGLGILEDAGHAIDIDAILNAPIQPNEQP